MDKSPDAFRTISEVADHLDTPAHVLRFWESRFPQVRPVKRAGGRRYYRPSDVALLAGIRRLLHEEGLTIRGVQKILREQGVRHVAGLAAAGSAGGEAIDSPADAAAAPPAPDAAPDAMADDGDDWDRDEWEDDETGADAAAVPAPDAPPAPAPAPLHDDLPLFAAPRAVAPPLTLPETQRVPLTGLRALRAATPPPPPPVAPPATASAEGEGTPALPADAEEVDLAPVLARLRALAPGALAPHREAIAALTGRLDALRAAQGKPARGSRG